MSEIKFQDDLNLDLEFRITKLRDHYFYNHINKISIAYLPDTVVSKQKYEDINKRLNYICMIFNEELKEIVKSVYSIKTDEDSYLEYYTKGKKTLKSHCETLLYSLIIK